MSGLSLTADLPEQAQSILWLMRVLSGSRQHHFENGTRLIVVHVAYKCSISKQSQQKVGTELTNAS